MSTISPVNRVSTDSYGDEDPILSLSALPPKAVNPNYRLTMQLNLKATGGLRVELGARNDGTLFMYIPDRFNLQGKRVSLSLPGVNMNSPQQDIWASVQKLVSNVDLVPYVYGANGQPRYNKGDAYVYGADGQPRINQGDTIPSLPPLAHGGARERMPPGFLESAWENSRLAIALARKDGAIPEVDYRLNKSSGQGVLSHDPIKFPVDRKGHLLPNAQQVDVQKDALENVKKVAPLLSDVLNEFPSTKDGNPSFAIEMKGEGFFSPSSEEAAKTARALYSDLKNAGRLQDVIITSLHPEMLTAIYNLAAQDKVPLKLMLVLGLNRVLTKKDVDNIKNTTPYIRYVTFPVDLLGRSPRTSKETVDYAIAQGLRPGGWNWDPFSAIPYAGRANKIFADLGLKIMITDDIRSLRKQQASAQRSSPYRLAIYKDGYSNGGDLILAVIQGFNSATHLAFAKLGRQYAFARLTHSEREEYTTFMLLGKAEDHDQAVRLAEIAYKLLSKASPAALAEWERGISNSAGVNWGITGIDKFNAQKSQYNPAQKRTIKAWLTDLAPERRTP